MAEHRLCKAGVRGSIPLVSTSLTCGFTSVGSSGEPSNGVSVRNSSAGCGPQGVQPVGHVVQGPCPEPFDVSQKGSVGVWAAGDSVTVGMPGILGPAARA